MLHCRLEGVGPAELRIRNNKTYGPVDLASELSAVLVT